jgi:hypothetical protein
MVLACEEANMALLRDITLAHVYGWREEHVEN